MVGTEFTYVYPNGDSIQAYVKKFDPEIGLTCMSLETESAWGHKCAKTEDDGTWCVIGMSFKRGPFVLKRALAYLDQIAKTGGYMPSGTLRGCGIPNCHF